MVSPWNAAEPAISLRLRWRYPVPARAADTRICRNSTGLSAQRSFELALRPLDHVIELLVACVNLDTITVLMAWL